jgi:hypothetical protein
LGQMSHLMLVWRLVPVSRVVGMLCRSGSR